MGIIFNDDNNEKVGEFRKSNLRIQNIEDNNKSVEIQVDVKNRQNRTRHQQNYYQLNSTFEQYTAMGDKLQNSQILALACRKYSEIFRKGNMTYQYDLQKAFGKNYEKLVNIDISKLSLIQLNDIVATFAYANHTCIIDMQEPNLNKFITLLLQQILNRKSIVQNSRDISYFCKAARCAQHFKNPLYIQLLKEVNQKIKDIQFYNILNLTNFVYNNRNSLKCTQLQFTILQGMNTNIINKKQLFQCKIKHIYDIINPLIEKSHSQVFNRQLITTQVVQLIEQVRLLLKEQYQQMTADQIYQIIKILFKADDALNGIRQYQLKDDPQFPSNIEFQIIKYCILLISQNGSSIISPLLIFRVILLINRRQLFRLICPNWQQRVLSMFKYYFMDNSCSAGGLIEMIYYNLSNGIMSTQNSIQFIQMLYNYYHIRSKQRPKKHDSKQLSTGARNQLPNNESITLLILYPLYLKYSQFKQSVKVIQLMDRIKWSSNKHKLFLYYLFLQINVEFLSTFGVQSNVSKFEQSVKINAKSGQKKQVFKISKQQKLIKKMQTMTYLKSIYENEQVRQCQKNFITGFQMQRILVAIVASLKHNLAYKIVIQIMSFLEADVNLWRKHLIIRHLSFMHIPQSEWNQVYDLIQKYDKNGQVIVSYAQEICMNKNINSRVSNLQAKLFMRILNKFQRLNNKNGANVDKSQIYISDKIILFLMTFNRNQFIQDVKHLIENKKYNNDNYQLLIIKILSFLISRSNNILWALQIQFTDEGMFVHFCKIAYPFMTKQQLLQFGIKNKFQIGTNIQSERQQVYQWSQNLIKIYKNNKLVKKNLQQLLKNMKQKTKVAKPQDLELLSSSLIRLVKLIKLEDFAALKQKQVQLIKQIFELVTEMVLNQRYLNIVCVFQLLKISGQKKWVAKRLFDKFMQLLQRQTNWKNDLDSEQIFALLIKYPTQQYSTQHMNLLIDIFLNSPNPKQANQLLSYVQNSSNKLDYPPQIYKFVVYIQNKINHGK